MKACNSIRLTPKAPPLRAKQLLIYIGGTTQSDVANLHNTDNKGARLPHTDQLHYNLLTGDDFLNGGPQTITYIPANDSDWHQVPNIHEFQISTEGRSMRSLTNMTLYDCTKHLPDNCDIREQNFVKMMLNEYHKPYPKFNLKSCAFGLYPTEYELLANSLQRFVESLDAAHPYTNINVVAHSRGCVIATTLLHNLMTQEKTKQNRMLTSSRLTRITLLDPVGKNYAFKPQIRKQNHIPLQDERNYTEKLIQQTQRILNWQSRPYTVLIVLKGQQSAFPYETWLSHLTWGKINHAKTLLAMSNQTHENMLAHNLINNLKHTYQQYTNPLMTSFTHNYTTNGPAPTYAQTLLHFIDGTLMNDQIGPLATQLYQLGLNMLMRVPEPPNTQYASDRMIILAQYITSKTLYLQSNTQ